MDKLQADAVSQAILAPSLKEQASGRAKLEAKTAHVASRRLQARYFLIGYGLGAAIGYFASGRIAAYGVVGGFVGLIIGGLVARRSARTAP